MRLALSEHDTRGDLGLHDKSVNRHADLIAKQVDASLADPETRRLAAAVASGAYDWVRSPRNGRHVAAVEYHDRFYRVAPGAKPPGVCRQRDHTCEIISIWNFIVLNVRYTADQDGADLYQDLRTTLETGSGDCDDACVVLCAMLRAIGYTCAIRIISQDGQSFSHVYALVKHPKTGWIALDPTEPGKTPGWEYPRAQARVDFLLE